MNRSLLAQLSLVRKLKQFSKGRLFFFVNLLSCLGQRKSGFLLCCYLPAILQRIKLFLRWKKSNFWLFFSAPPSQNKQTKKYKSGFRLSGNVSSFALFSLDLDFYPEFLLFCFCKTCFQCKIFRSVSFSKATSCIFNVNCH